jgi:hypothetical protein
MSPMPFLLDKQIGMWIHALPLLFGTHHEKTQDKKTITVHLPIFWVALQFLTMNLSSQLCKPFLPKDKKGPLK